jgi:predicted small lipoprotein YifL
MRPGAAIVFVVLALVACGRVGPLELPPPEDDVREAPS